MKVNYGSELGTEIRNIPVGEVFFAERKSVKERGLYMKVDGNSGIVPKKCSMCYAVNLETGQLRHFSYDAPVTRAKAEVNLLKD